jgi:ribosomal protein S18 acetylase RimI-like enzyme
MVTNRTVIPTRSDRLDREALVSWSLRPVREDEVGLIVELMEEGFRADLESQGLLWQPKRLLERYGEAEERARCRFVIVDGEVVGLLQTLPREREIEILEIALRESARGRGIGGDLIREVRAGGLPVRLEVLKSANRAQRFYTRHGFVRVGETETHVVMRTVD